jgi:hypothetical protein
MDALTLALLAAPLIAVAGIFLSWMEVSRIRRFVPGAFDSGLLILREAVADRTIGNDPNCIAHALPNVVLFVRRTVGGVFSAFPAGRIVRSAAGAEVQVRLAYGFVVFYLATFAFFSIATVLTKSRLLLLFVAATALSTVAVVRRERVWGRSAAASATKLLPE